MDKARFPCCPLLLIKVALRVLVSEGYRYLDGEYECFLGDTVKLYHSRIDTWVIVPRGYEEEELSLWVFCFF